MFNDNSCASLKDESVELLVIKEVALHGIMTRFHVMLC